MRCYRGTVPSQGDTSKATRILGDNSRNKNKQYFIETAIKVAMKSSMRTKHGAIIVRGNQIISLGYNDYYTKQLHGRWSIHAEVSAISSLRKTQKKKFSDYDLYVIRVDKKGYILNSKPCKKCEKLCNDINIGRVFYSC